MNSSNIKRNTPRATVAVSAFAAMGALLVAPVAGAPAMDTSAEAPFSRQCFMERPAWNVALDGPVPQCPGPRPGAGQPDTREHSRSSPGSDWVGGLVRSR